MYCMGLRDSEGNSHGWRKDSPNFCHLMGLNFSAFIHFLTPPLCHDNEITFCQWASVIVFLESWVLLPRPLQEACLGSIISQRILWEHKSSLSLGFEAATTIMLKFIYRRTCVLPDAARYSLKFRVPQLLENFKIRTNTSITFKLHS